MRQLGCTFLLFLLTFLPKNRCYELTFALASGKEQCFYEEIQKNTETRFEFQVIKRGDHLSDIILLDPQRHVIHHQRKKLNGGHSFITEYSGTYSLCFSNKFLNFFINNQMVYLEWEIEKGPIPGLLGNESLTQIEKSAEAIHQTLKKIYKMQIWSKWRMSGAKARSEALNGKVFWWSILETCVIIMTGLGQVHIVQKFFK